MNKLLRLLLLLLLLLPLFSAPAQAEDYTESAEEALGLDAVREALPEELRALGGDGTLSDAFDGVGALERLWDRFLALAANRLRAEGRDALRVFAVCLLCTVGAMLVPGQKQAETIQIAGCASLACVLADGMGSAVGEAFSSLIALSDYAKAALPALYTAAAACGAAVSAPAGYAISCLALDLLMSAAEALILPVLNVYIALAVSGSLFDNPLLRGGVKLCRKLAVLAMTGLTAAFTALLGIGGLVSGSADAAAVKAAKSALSLVPVVGKVLSEAGSAAVAAAGLVKNSAGAFGLVAVCALCLSPFALLAVRRLFFGLAAAAAELTAGERVARLLGDFSALMGMLLGLVGCFGLMLFFCIVSAMKAVTG